MFDEQQISEIKQTSIVNYLLASGYAKKEGTGKWTFFFSPFRNESKPSLGVNNDTNTWADFGTEDGGDIISLVMKIENLSFNDACEFISEGSTVKFIPFERKEEPRPSVEVEISDINDARLDHYMTQIRMITPEVLYKYCSVVRFNFPQSEYNIPCYAIGFKNDKGGWAIRNEHYKISSKPNGFTTIGEDTEKVNLFEGFINFLSALTHFGRTEFNNRTYVLNGAGNISALLPLIRHKQVMYFGDNDETGNKLLRRIRKHGTKVEDCRVYYEFFSDFNEYLTN